MISPSLSCVVLCIDGVDVFEMSCHVYRKVKMMAISSPTLA